MRDGDLKNMLAYNEFTYKKTYNHCKLEDRFQKKGHFSIACKKTAYNEVQLYVLFYPMEALKTDIDQF